MATVNQIFEKYSSDPVDLHVESRLDEEDDQEWPYVLIEGDARALRMLGELILALADGTHEDEVQFEPYGAGSIHWTPASKVGLYVNKLPSEKP